MESRMVLILRQSATLFLIFLLSAAPACAVDSATEMNSIFWKKMKIRLQLVVPEREVSAISVPEAVGDTADSLYWKGREAFTVVPEAELAAFNMALQFVMDGSHDQALQGFRDFLANYPGSKLAGEAQAALAELGSGK